MESSAASFSSSSSGASFGAVDPSQLLSGAGSGRDNNWNQRFGRRAGLRGAARLLRRAAMREPSIRVRETAAEQLEEAQSDWAYSRPVVVLDIVWNLAFVGAAEVVMVVSRDEAPSMPLRLWIAGYAMQCLLHTVCVGFECRRRQGLQRAAPVELVGSGGGEGLVGEVQPGGGGGGFGAQQMGQEDRTRMGQQKKIFVSFRDTSSVNIITSRKVMVRYQNPLQELSPSVALKHLWSMFYRQKECCVCLSAYEDGVELRELPCCHHFHCACIDKWLYMSASCPSANSIL